MGALVAEVENGSIAQELEITAGDELLTIDEIAPKDLIEYRYMMMSEELTIVIKKQNYFQICVDTT